MYDNNVGEGDWVYLSLNPARTSCLALCFWSPWQNENLLLDIRAADNDIIQYAALQSQKVVSVYLFAPRRYQLTLQVKWLDGHKYHDPAPALHGKHGTSTQCRVKAGPASKTLAQH